MTDSATIMDIFAAAEQPLNWRSVAVRYKKRFGAELSNRYIRERFRWLLARGYIQRVSHGLYAIAKH